MEFWDDVKGVRLSQKKLFTFSHSQDHKGNKNQCNDDEKKPKTKLKQSDPP